MEQYTKAVMQHFMKPKNLGRIEKADAVGKLENDRCGDVMIVYLKIGKRKARGQKNDKKEEEFIKDIKFQTLGCLPPEEKVLVNEGDWADVSSVINGSTVLNGSGEQTKVIENYVREYNGMMLTIIPFISRFNSFSVTPEHPILSIKRNWLKKARKSSAKCNWLRINEAELLSTSPDFVEASNLEIGDYLVYVPNKKVKDSSIFTEDLMKLTGYYLSEGYVTARESVLNFAFNKNEKEYIEDVRKLAKKIIGKEGSYRTRGSVTEIRICSTKWAKFFIKVCGKYATHKKLSEDILILPFEKQWKMIETYVKGDGNIYKRRPNNTQTYRISTSSKELAIQIQEILARGKIFSSIKEDKRFRPNHTIEGRKVAFNKNYEVSFRLEISRNRFYHFNSNYFLIPIKKIEKNKYNGKVYNFQVSGEPPSYLVRGFAVHNCPAAIAASDVLCEIVKGKSLKEAEKINETSITKKLGGLPLIKVHCSVLGAKTLKNAIENYRKKQR